ncbi:MAG: hypothetical protein FJ009_21635 [Chloroflexi bacterium]|nr:hypothetical protein [Chloroflexota bacterium]
MDKETGLQISGTATQAPEVLIARFAALPDFAPTTQETYRRALAHWLGWVRDGGDPRAARAFKAHLRDAGLSPFTSGVYLTALRRFYAWAVEQGFASANPAQGVKGEKKPRGHLRDNITEDEAARVLRLIDRVTLAGKRDYALVYLLMRCGLRLIETRRADVGDIRTKDGVKVLFVQGKGRTAKDDWLFGNCRDAH